MTECVESAAPVLVMRGITKQFGGVTVLRSVDFSVRAGEVHALMGENGAGKSTLMKILGGVCPATAGTISLAGRPLIVRGPGDALRSGVALIHQEISLVPTLSVAENILLGAEPRHRVRCSIDRERMREEARRLLAALDDRIPPDAAVLDLSLAEQQVVEIARALRHENRILVMDEPTAALSEREAERLFALIRRLRDQGVGIVYISHRMPEVERLADRVTVLRDGEHAGELPRGSFDRSRIVALMVGRAVPELAPAHRGAGERPARLEVRGLSDTVGRVRGVDLKVGAGEILGLAGLMGAGRSELARLIAGIDPRSAGRIRLDGDEVSLDSPRAAFAAGVAYLPEDRKSQGLFLQRSAGENMTMTLAGPSSRVGVLRLALLRDYGQRAVTAFGIRLTGLEQEARLLSGGNQQKLLFARALALEPRVLLLDEPTRGVDVGAKQEIYRKIAEIAATGVAVVVISSELPELLLLCARIAVLHEGRLAGVLDRAKDDVTQETLMALATGHPPDALS
jgi:ribose transport system ATP-binding protein